MPIPSPYTYDTLLANVCKGVCVSPWVQCKKCESIGTFLYTNTYVPRGGVVQLKDDDRPCFHHDLRIPLGKCENCGSRLRILSIEFLPHKRYSLPVMEVCILNFKQEETSLRKAAHNSVKNQSDSPHYSTISRWIINFGNRAADHKATTTSYPPPTSAILIELGKRIGIDLSSSYRPREQPVYSFKYRSEKRRDQLQHAYALLTLLHDIFANSSPGKILIISNAALLPIFYVPVWNFPTMYLLTPMQHPHPP